MIDIPKQLQNPEFRFIKLKSKSKVPFEMDWQNTGNYSFNNTEFVQHLNENGNYGVCGGYGGLVIIDCDKYEIVEVVENSLPETFTVKTGRGGMHFYFYCPDLKKPVRLIEDKAGDLGDVQGRGKQVVGPGSTHPNGNKYEIFNDTEIAEIKAEQIYFVLKDFIRNEINDIVTEEKSQNKDVEIDISKVIETAGLTCRGDEYQGAHPVHGSDGGMNFCVNPSLGIWHCFRHQTGGGALSWIAVKERLIECSGAVKGAIRGKLFRNVINIASEKYKLDVVNRFKIGMTEFSNKLKMADAFLEIQPLYYDRNKLWWMWDFDKNLWSMVDEVDIMNKIDESFSNLSTVSMKERGEILEALKRRARLSEPLPIKPTWVQFKDKIIDIETGETHDVNAYYFATNPIPWDLGDTEETPNMDRIFTEWVGVEKLPMIYEIIAYSLSGSYFIHRIFSFLGSGANGKSSFFTLMIKFLGEHNCCSVELDDLIRNRFMAGKLYKKLVCLMGETNFGTLTKTSILKKLTGQDMIGYEFKNKNPFDDRNYAKIMIATNTLPMTFDRTMGFYRRWESVDFPNTFTGSDDILRQIPEEEYRNLATKCVRLLKELWLRRTFTGEGSMEDKMRIYEEKSNPMKLYLKTNYEISFDGKVLFSDFYSGFNTFCQEKGMRKHSAKEVGVMLREDGYLVKTINAKNEMGNMTSAKYIMGLA